MNRKFLPLLVIFFLCGCSSGEPGESTRQPPSASAQDPVGVRAEIQRLSGMTPVPNEVLLEWLPESLGEYERTSYVSGRAGVMDVSAIEGSYKNAEGNLFKIEILDGAGETGSVLISSLLMIKDVNVEKDTETQRASTVEHEGMPAWQTYYPKQNKTDLQFAYDNRFGVMVTARGMNPERAWELVDRMPLEGLNELDHE